MVNENKILVINDHPEMLDFIVHNLIESWGVLTAPDAISGFKLAQGHLPDLVILDTAEQAGQKRGFINRLRSDQRTDHIPVIQLSRNQKTEFSEDKTGEYADALLPKPFHPRELNQLVVSVLKRRER